jgi:two-component system chemotaxis sensor kinase CheA
MATFLEELQEHLRVFNRELLALEQKPGDEAVAESVKVLFRAAHSLKGAARSVQATRLEAIGHRMEEALAAVRDGKRALDAPLCAQLFAAVDEMEAAGKELANRHAASTTVDAPRQVVVAKAGGEPSPSDIGARDARDATGGPAELPEQRVRPPIPEPRRGDARLEPVAPGESTQAVDIMQVVMSRTPARAERSRPVRPIEPGGAVRVPRRRLDALLAQSGELLVARRRFESRSAELQSLQELLSAWRSEWRLADQALRRWGRKQAAESHGVGLPARVERFFRNSGTQLARVERELERLSLGLTDDRRTLDRTAGPLRDQIHKARLVPFTEACEGLHRAVRDLTLSQGKEVELSVDAGQTELDRSIVDGLRDPLLHMIRNAVAHGAEAPEERLARGKPRAATVVVRAALHGEMVEVSVSDDGRGLDLAAIAAQARERGLGAELAPGELSQLIFEPGFSTQRDVSTISGRGVGLDVVKSQIEAMRGSVSVAFEAGAGTSFKLRLPLTLTTLRVLLVRAGSEIFGLPTSSVRTMVRAGPETLCAIGGRDALRLGETPLPIASLGQTLGLSGGTLVRGRDKLPIAVVSGGEQQVALAVDELIAEQDVMLKAFGPRLGRPRHFSGATLLQNGQIALVLNPHELVRSALSSVPTARWSEHFASTAPAAPKRLLLVDDSITTRTLEKSILEAAGHEVTTASDGRNAWQILQEQGADLVVSDVEMPNMDGFTLTQTIRSSKRFKNLPVILLTALHSEQDRARGLELGADAYLLKTTFDQKLLLETIRELL